MHLTSAIILCLVIFFYIITKTNIIANYFRNFKTSIIRYFCYCVL
ncbi:hypothetical protein Paride_0210 [Pseudomonas phage Paride]|nr:hypothetical protein Deiofobo_0210 [Pseudomonas phage Deifobo]WPK39920.1 hypothetical protein ETTORE_0211 [Pseudomonas phage Ettore]WPK40440.1 hypothetical protein Paride_0210 [Pseudomonas phage Paride]